MTAERRMAAEDWRGARGEKWRASLAGMEATLAPVDEPLLAALRVDAPCRIADIGCGGGATSRHVARRAPAGSVVHGFDISPALIDAARAAGPSDVTLAFHLADVATAPVPSSPYDRIMSRFGVMFFDEPHQAFSNLRAWLAPAGHLAFAVWGPARDNAFLSLAREVVETIVAVPAAEPDAPGPFRYEDESALRRALERAGFDAIEAHTWRESLAIGGGMAAPAAAHFVLTSFSLGDLLAQAGDAAFERAHEALTRRFSDHEQNGAVRLDASVHVVTATRR